MEKQKSAENMSQLTKELFYENEKRINKKASLVLLILGMVYVVSALLYFFDIFNLCDDIVAHSFIINGLICAVISVIAGKNQFKAKWLKYLIVFGAMISIGISYFFFPLNNTFIYYLPIVVSALYYDTKFMYLTTFFNWLLYSVLLLGNVVAEKYSPLMQSIHASQYIFLWSDPKEVIIYRFIPYIIFFAFTAFICKGITNGGKNLVLKQAKISSEISTVETELKAASNIQQSSLEPKSYIDDNGNINIKAFMRPAKVVGGDFYDYFRAGDNIVTLVADVSDKGLPAAMFMMKAKDALRLSIGNGKKIEEAVESVNNLLCHNNNENMFLTLFVAEMNVNTGVGKFVNCGHNPPIIKHADGSVSRLLNEPETVIGIFENNSINSHIFTLTDGDSLILFTDGLTDAADSDNNAFGDENLLSAVKNYEGAFVSLCEKIINDIDEFSSGSVQFDDMTLLSMNFGKAISATNKKYSFETGDNVSETLINEVDEILNKYSCPDDERRNIDVAIDEICDNINEYAYSDKKGEFTAEINVSENYIEFTFTDSGIAFNPLESESPDISGEPEIGGLGLYLVKNIMDKIEYCRKDDKNILKLLKIWNI